MEAASVHSTRADETFPGSPRETPGVARRVVWVNQYALTPGEAGGTRQFELGQALGRRGWVVEVVASDFHLHSRRFTRRSAHDRSMLEQDFGPLRFTWLWAFPYAKNDWRRILNWFTFAWRLNRDLSRRPPPAAVIGSSPSPVAAFGAWWLSWRWNVPFLLEVRDLWPESLEAVAGRRGAAYHMIGQLMRFLYRRAIRVVVVSPGMAGPLIAQGVEEWRIVWVPNGVDTNLFEAPERQPRAAVTLVYAGAHGPANGLGMVLEAARLLQPRSEIKFVLIGDGSEKSRLEEQARAWGLTNVSFLPPVPKDQLQKALTGADAGLMVLMPSPLFAMGASPNKLFDYLACGLPVVSNVPGEIATLIRDSGAGEQATDASGEALAAAIVRLADRTPEERVALGAAGRSWVVRERDRDRLASRLEEALLSALAEGVV